MKLEKGFTIIELVVVIVVIGILAAVALPRFLGLQDRAHDAVVEGTQAALASGVLMANSLWMSYARETALDHVMKKDVNGDGDAADAGESLSVTATGYPVRAITPAATQDGVDNTLQAGALGGTDCQTLFTFLLSNQSVKTTSAANATAANAMVGGVEADSFEFSAYASTSPVSSCEYVYLKDKSTTGASGLRTITYDTVSGAVSVAGLTESTFSD